MSVSLNPNRPGFGDARWIVSEDVNIEHLLDAFTSIDPDSNDIWDACVNFIRHLNWYKPRQVVLGLKIEALPTVIAPSLEVYPTLQFVRSSEIPQSKLAWSDDCPGSASNLLAPAQPAVVCTS